MATPLTVGNIDGVVMNAPPVYDPGGPVAAAVSLPDELPLTESEIDAFIDAARDHGAILAIIRCPVNGNPMRRHALDELGFTVSSAWFVGAPSADGVDDPALRPASADDVPAMIRLLTAHRERLEGYSPVFWRRAPDAARASEPFLAAQLLRENVTSRIFERDGSVAGFGIFAGNGVDDFCVANRDDWPTVGVAVLASLARAAAAGGVQQLTIVSPDADDAKCGAIESLGFARQFRWHVLPLGR